MIRGERNAVREHTLVAVRKELSAGAALASALHNHRLLDATGFAIVSTGEGAGKLDDSLQHAAALDHDRLDDRYALIAQWLPVLAYTCVAAAAVIGLLG